MSNSTQNETHNVCNERLAKEGGNARCCDCEPHEGCTLGDRIPEASKTIQNDWENYCPEFGDYVYIPQKRYGCENEIYQYLVIECLESNGYVDVPVQSPAVETLHEDIVPVVSCLCDGIGHKEVMRYRLSDIVRVRKNPRLADARREVISQIEHDIIGFEIDNKIQDEKALRSKHLIDWYNGALLKVRNYLATLREEGV